MKDDHEVTRWAKQGTLREVEAYTTGSSSFGELQVLWLWLEHEVCREEGQELRQKREVGARSIRQTNVLKHPCEYVCICTCLCVCVHTPNNRNMNKKD